MKLRVKGDNFTWRVSEEFLRREVPIVDPSSKPTSSAHGSATATGSDALVDMLRRELDIKNHQITQQSEMLTNQIELISGGPAYCSTIRHNVDALEFSKRLWRTFNDAIEIGNDINSGNTLAD